VNNIPEIGQFHRQITAVGSRVTCSPAPTGTDQDWLVRIEEADYDAFAQHLLSTGWEVGGSLIPNDANYLPTQQRFNSFTKGEDNVIATASVEFHRRFLAASATAKRLNLLDKADRIALFQAVLYGATGDHAFAEVHPFPTIQTNELEEVPF
jgi:hypothetical protein